MQAQDAIVPEKTDAAANSAADPSAGARDMAAMGADSEFLSNLAHQLRSPLSSLRVWVDLLKDPSATTGQQDLHKLVDGIDRATSRLERQITDILEAGYIEAGTLSISPQPVEMAPEVINAIESVEQAARSRRITVDLRVEDGIFPVMADTQRVRQVLHSLISNAAKFTPVGGKVGVTISTQRPAGHPATDDQPSPRCTWLTEPVTPVMAVYLTVSDGGPGIDPSLHREIFKPFFRASRHGIPGGGGSGLGLAIALGLVRLHGGEMWVRSEPGDGAEFGFSLPAASESVDEP